MQVLISEQWVQDLDRMMQDSPVVQPWASLVNGRGFDTRTNFHYSHWNAECNFNEAFS